MENRCIYFCFILYEVTFQKVKNWKWLFYIKRRNILASVNICNAFRVFFFVIEKNLSCKAAQAVPSKQVTTLRCITSNQKHNYYPSLIQYNRQEMPVSTFIISKRHNSHMCLKTLFTCFSIYLTPTIQSFTCTTDTHLLVSLQSHRITSKSLPVRKTGQEGTRLWGLKSFQVFKRLQSL